MVVGFARWVIRRYDALKFHDEAHIEVATMMICFNAIRARDVQTLGLIKVQPSSEDGISRPGDVVALAAGCRTQDECEWDPGNRDKKRPVGSLFQLSEQQMKEQRTGASTVDWHFIDRSADTLHHVTKSALVLLAFWPSGLQGADAWPQAEKRKEKRQKRAPISELVETTARCPCSSICDEQMMLEAFRFRPRLPLPIAARLGPFQEPCALKWADWCGSGHRTVPRSG